MAGVNKVGNNGRLRKTEVEHLIDFRRLSHHKGNRMITKNFTSYISGTFVEQADLITFLIFESKRNNAIELNTHLLTKYSKYIRATKEHFSGIKYKGKSIMTTRGMLQNLIGNGILIPLMRQTFLINPALTYFEGYYNEQTMFMVKYEELYQKYALGGFGKSELHKRITEIGREYYKQCLTKNV